MAKAQSNSKLRRKPGAGRGRHVTGRRLVEFKKREPSTVQKTVRLRRPVVAALEEEAASVKPDGISVPSAIVQIVEDWYAKRETAKETARATN